MARVQDRDFRHSAVHGPVVQGRSDRPGNPCWDTYPMVVQIGSDSSKSARLEGLSPRLIFDRNVLLNNNLRQHDRVEAEPNQSAALVGAIWGLFRPPLMQLHPIIGLRFSRSAAVFTAKLHHHAISLDLRSYLENGAYEKPAEILTRQPLPHWSSMLGYTRFQRP